MTELPTGTVAFLMTDIEGSTRLVRDLGPAFPTLLGDHFRLLGGAIEDAGGTLVSSEGGSATGMRRCRSSTSQSSSPIRWATRT